MTHARETSRQHPRFQLDVRVDWRAEGRAVRRTSGTSDVGAGGLMILTAEPEPVGTRVRLRVLTFGGGVDAEAVVVRTRAGGMAVELQDSERVPLAPLRKIFGSPRGRLALP